MFSDARSLSEGQTLEADICIIGGGAAGISLALEMGKTAHRILLLESGGLEFEDDTQALYDGESVGWDYYPLDATRLRFFGGTTNHWGGMCTRLNPIDFEQRPWVPLSGWPIRLSDLEPHFERAHELCQIGPVDYDGDGWAVRQGRPQLQPHLPRFISRAAQFSPPTRFGEVYREPLERFATVHVLLHATVSELVQDEAGKTLAHVAGRTLAGNTFAVRARTYVLACGAIENARILLLSNQQEPAGVGNRHDLVGRHFMEHLSVWPGWVVPSGKVALAPFFEIRTAGAFDIGGYLAMSEAQQREEGLLNLSFFLEPRDKIHFPQPKGVRSAHRLAQDIKQGTLPDHFFGHVRNVLTDFDKILDRTHDKLTGKESETVVAENALLAGISMEQAPDPQSRVTLSEDRDALGLNRVRLDWRLGELDRHTWRRGMEIFGAEMTRAGLGQLWMEDPDTADGWPEETYGHHHHMGTTRMHDDPRQGVVDRDCRVHGLENLYVAGGSVFPTGGYSWPTLNIVALTLRLARHLTEKMG